MQPSFFDQLGAIGRGIQQGLQPSALPKSGFDLSGVTSELDALKARTMDMAAQRSKMQYQSHLMQQQAKKDQALQQFQARFKGTPYEQIAQFAPEQLAKHLFQPPQTYEDLLRIKELEQKISGTDPAGAAARRKGQVEEIERETNVRRSVDVARETVGHIRELSRSPVGSALLALEPGKIKAMRAFYNAAKIGGDTAAWQQLEALWNGAGLTQYGISPSDPRAGDILHRAEMVQKNVDRVTQALGPQGAQRFEQARQSLAPGAGPEAQLKVWSDLLTDQERLAEKLGYEIGPAPNLDAQRQLKLQIERGEVDVKKDSKGNIWLVYPGNKGRQLSPQQAGALGLNI
jgi:hypothetical protein